MSHRTIQLECELAQETHTIEPGIVDSKIPDYNGAHALCNIFVASNDSKWINILNVALTLPNMRLLE